MASPRPNAPDRHLHDAADGQRKHGRLPARAMRWEETASEEIDEADVCELGSYTALAELRRERAAARE